MNVLKNVAVIGGGPAGMMAAIAAAQKGCRVALFEKNNRCGKKLGITGKGRCNITNACTLEAFLENVPVNAKFLFSAYSKFPCDEVMRFFEGAGVPLKIERGNRVFPVSDKASDIVRAFENTMREAGVRVIRTSVEEIIFSQDSVEGLRTASGGNEHFDAVIVATGGLSYPLTGSTGDGYRFAQHAGHKIIRPRPSLVPLISLEGFCAELAGLSLKNVTLTVRDTLLEKDVFSDFGELLFTHFGLSGPLVLTASAHMKEMSSARYLAVIDLKPALTVEELDKRLLRDFKKYENRNFQNALDDLLPNKLIGVMVHLSGISPFAKVHQITRLQREGLVTLLKAFPISIAGARPIEEAVVTSGGVDVAEISPKTMESRLKKGLFFAGEVFDVDAYTGGFNLQIALSTGFAAGSSI